MVARTILATLDGAAPHERLQVSLLQRPDGRLAIDLREQHHAEGIGWFDQRTLSLDPAQYRQLVSVLGSQPSALRALSEAPAMTLPFPGPRTPEPQKPAVGSEG